MYIIIKIDDNNHFCSGLDSDNMLKLFINTSAIRPLPRRHSLTEILDHLHQSHVSTMVVIKHYNFFCSSVECGRIMKI